MGQDFLKLEIASATITCVLSQSSVLYINLSLERCLWIFMKLDSNCVIIGQNPEVKCRFSIHRISSLLITPCLEQ